MGAIDICDAVKSVYYAVRVKFKSGSSKLKLSSRVVFHDRRGSGPYRAVHSDNDRTTFDLMYHDERKPRAPSGEHESSLGDNHPSSRH